MTNGWKERLIDSVEDYAKAVENEAYDKVLTILWSKYNLYDKIISSGESQNIFIMSTGESLDKLYDKRKSLRKKIYLILEFINKVKELRFGTF